MEIVHGVGVSNARATTQKKVHVGSSASLEATSFVSPLGLVDGGETVMGGLGVVVVLGGD